MPSRDKFQSSISKSFVVRAFSRDKDGLLSKSKANNSNAKAAKIVTLNPDVDFNKSVLRPSSVIPATTFAHSTQQQDDTDELAKNAGGK